MAAIALTQLKRLDYDNAYRKQISQWYRDGLKAYGDKIKFIRIPYGCESSCHLFQIMVEDRDGLMEYLNKHDIFPGVHYVENTQYKMYSYAEGTCPKASYASDHILTLPIHMRLKYEDIQMVIKRIVEFISN